MYVKPFIDKYTRNEKITVMVLDPKKHRTAQNNNILKLVSQF